MKKQAKTKKIKTEKPATEKLKGDESETNCAHKLKKREAEKQG